MEEIRRSCADCATKGCDGKGGTRPAFCLSDDLPEGAMEAALGCYGDGEEGGCSAPPPRWSTTGT